MRKTIKKTIEEEVTYCDLCGKIMDKVSFTSLGAKLLGISEIDEDAEWPDVHENCAVKYCQEQIKSKLKL